MFIEQQERSDQSAVEPLGCNSDFTLKLDAAPEELDSEREETTCDFNQQCDLAAKLAETPNFR
jgi:hypothetical protein